MVSVTVGPEYLAGAIRSDAIGPFTTHTSDEAIDDLHSLLAGALA